MIAKLMAFFADASKITSSQNILSGLLTIIKELAMYTSEDKTAKNALIDTIIAELQAHKDQ